jgi:peptidoglycan/xylan/chitin deacetylase (PgdA/CDA1 family)
MADLRWVTKYCLAAILYYTGFVAIFRWARRKLGKADFKILAYHGIDDRPNIIDLFVPVKLFSRQIQFLKSSYDVISLDDAVARLKSDNWFDHDTMVITIDDGYRDNYEHVWPILESNQTPALIYLTTEPLDSGFTTFIDALLRAIENTAEASIDMSEYGLGRLALLSATDKKTAIEKMDGHGQGLDAGKRMEFLNNVLPKLGFTTNDKLFTDGMLTWEQVRSMNSNLIRFGAHTHNHPVMSRLSPEQAQFEIETSQKRIAAETGSPVRHFAYPYGSHTAINETAVKAVAACDFDSAVVLYNAPINSEEPYRLGRVMVSEMRSMRPGGGFSRCLFATEMSGLFDLLFARN